MDGNDCMRVLSVLKRTTGWVFADIFHHYFGDSTLILTGEGKKGEDLKLAISTLWLEENHVLNFASRDEAISATEHITNCTSPFCQEANKRYELMIPFFSYGLPPAIALTSIFHSRLKGEECRISRKNDIGEAIDQIKPMFFWFIDDKDFWKWPD
jgi:hypothetical protein